MADETLTWSFDAVGYEIFVTLVSGLTSEEVAKWMVVEVGPHSDVDLAVDAAEESISEVVDDYYGKRVRCDEKIQRHGELVDELWAAIGKARRYRPRR